MEEEHEQELWDRYWSDRSIENRNALVLKYMYLLRIHLAGYSNDSRDMLYGYAAEGLIRAVEKYKPGIWNFQSYARIRVRGAIQDGWRDNDSLPRRAREWITAYTGAMEELSQEKGAEAGDSLIVRSLDLTDKKKYGVAAALIFSPARWTRWDTTRLGVYADSLQDPDPEISPHTVAVQESIRETVGDLVSRLPERSKVVISLYYYEHMTLRQIGEVLGGLTEARICQIHTKALKELREMTTDISLLHEVTV